MQRSEFMYENNVAHSKSFESILKSLKVCYELLFKDLLQI